MTYQDILDFCEYFSERDPEIVQDLVPLDLSNFTIQTEESDYVY